MYYTWFLMNIDPPPCFTLQVLWLLHFSTSIDFFSNQKFSRSRFGTDTFCCAYLLVYIIIRILKLFIPHR